LPAAVKAADIGASKQGKAGRPPRQYYHARFGLPLTKEDLDYDSEDNSNYIPDLRGSNKALDEYNDVTFEEKEAMKLWNQHIAAYPPYGDGYVPLICESFVRQYGPVILAKGLRHNFLIHFMNLWDFSLIDGNHIKRLIAIIDDCNI